MLFIVVINDDASQAKWEAGFGVDQPRPYVAYFGLPHIDVPHGGWAFHIDNVAVDAR